ncbi:hypothetical protein H4S04_001727 [Coemansia sp. S16]|nr:hypothetical protein H4S04_001727 [Coemansia sp. S16]
MPRTAEEAISILRGNVIIAYKDCMEYLGSLANALQGDNLGRFESAGDMELAIRGIHAAYEKLLADSSITGDDCGDFLKVLMEVLYNCRDGRGSVVIIDEYDKPIFCALRELGIGKETREDIVGVYSQFYSALLKSVSIDIIKPTGEKPYWTRVGSLSMIRNLRAKDASLFRMYANRLINEYYLRSVYQYGNMSTKGALESRILSEKTGLAMFNDVAYSHEANQFFGIDTASLDKLAKVCFNALIDDYQNWSNENLAAETAFSLLYQAGYLTLLPNGHVGIPNRDVFSELESLIARL